MKGMIDFAEADRVTIAGPERARIAKKYPAAEGGEAFCGKSNKGGYRCTREIHSDGPHVAHDTRATAIALWEAK